MKKYLVLLIFYTHVACCLNVNAQWTSKEIITTDSIRLRYYTKGIGQPVLMISGGPGYNAVYLFSAADSLSSSAYRSTDLKFIVPDLRGTGSSTIQEGHEASITFGRIINDLDQIRQQEGVTNWIIMGHSFGGLLASYYARVHPGSVKGLVLLSSVSPAGFWGSNILAQKSIRLREHELQMLEQINRQLDKGHDEKLKQEYDRILLPVYLGSRTDTTNVAIALKGIKINTRCFTAMLDNNREPLSELEKNISPYKGPVLILHGRMDPTGEGQAYENQKRLPQAGLEFINRAGHFLWVENSTLFNIHWWGFFQKLR
jgi:proline iminopeptidase